MARKTQDAVQFAALPCRVAPNGRPEVMLLTSRETRRWVIPQGWPIKGLKPHEVAAREAYEEAGLVGTIVGKRPIGIYHYEKQLPEGGLLCQVQVFLLLVDQQADEWPEKGLRETRWFDTGEAANLVNEGGLAEIVQRGFAPPQHQAARGRKSRRSKGLGPRTDTRPTRQLISKHC